MSSSADNSQSTNCNDDEDQKKPIEESVSSLKLDDDILDDSSIKIELKSTTTATDPVPQTSAATPSNVHTIKITYSLPTDIPMNNQSLSNSIPVPPPLPPPMAPPMPPPMPNNGPPIPPPMPNNNGPPIPPPMPNNNGPPMPPPMPNNGPPMPPPMPNNNGPPMAPPMPLPNLNNIVINSLSKKRIVYSPKCMMKTLYWSRVNVVQQQSLDSPSNSVSDQKTIWEYTDDLELKFEEFEKLFAQPKLQPKKVKSIEKEEKNKVNETADLLDRNRAHNLNILIRGLRIDTVELANAIYNFDSHTFHYEKLKKISEIVATSEELDSINDHLKTSPNVPLGNAERFLYDLNQIHCFGDRINCFLFTLQFDEQIQSIEHSLNNFKVVCRFLLKSSSLRNLISIILTLGNYMNSNTTRGQLDAFDISILPKLKDTKSSVDNSCNLLYYVVKIYIDQNFNQEDILKKKDLTTKLPVPEPQDLERASTVSFNEIKKELDSIKSQIKTIEERFRRVIDSCTQQQQSPDELHIEPFQGKMKSMIEYATKIHQEHEESLEECQQMFVETMSFFSYKPKSVNLADQQREFFGIWLNFCTNFKDLFRKVINAKIKEVVDNAKQGANKIMNKNVKIIKNNNEKQSLKPNGLKARLINKFKR